MDQNLSNLKFFAPYFFCLEPQSEETEGESQTEIQQKTAAEIYQGKFSIGHVQSFRVEKR